ncbi:putative Antibiotic biosynthesis monooxygenase [Seiridium cardinale]|uniref:Antibiotic biosynthesis monooxygenase n=1 Tax=Seiridium cardinale TaxID=138064 RepID=A0ABR2Y1E4_9PEZI
MTDSATTASGLIMNPECLLFDVFQDPATPGKFRFVEIWNASKERFEKEQLTKTYYATMWDQSKPTWEKEAQLEYFEREGEGSIYQKGYLDGGRLAE